MSQPIPEDWLKAVCSILATRDYQKIIIRLRARNDFQALFPGAMDFELVDAFVQALQAPGISGSLVESMSEPGIVYEFIFVRENLPIYGKINLSSEGTVVIIYSAHRPLKGNQL
ncbi:MAG: hypothetical protein HC904_08395 [Blastochloris sp.]|nr:hypothetical protein [Blastochloris sp.]